MAINQNPNARPLGLIEREIPTEFAVNFFGLASGTFGALAGLVAARRLSQASDDIPLKHLIIPITVAGASTVLGALLVPTDV